MSNTRRVRFGRVAAAAVALMSVAGTMAACGSDSSSADGVTTIRFAWWGNDDRAAATEKAVELFEAANPDIKVETEFGDYGSYVQKLTTQVAAQAAPDVIQLDRPTFGEYAQRNVLVNLDDYVDDGTLDLSMIPDELLAGEQYEGVQYALPAGQTTQMMVYDVKAFEKIGVDPSQGWTWSEFTDAMQQLADSTGTAGFTDIGWAIDWFDTWLHQRGKSVYTPEGALGFEVADLAEFWTWTNQMREDGLATPAEMTTQQDGSTTNSGLIADASSIEENYDSNLTGYVGATTEKLAAAPLPTDTPGADTSGMAALPPVYYGVPRSSQNAEAAVKLLDFLMNDPEAGAALGASRGIPPNTDIRADVCDAADEVSKMVCTYEDSVADQVGDSSTWGWPTGSSSVKADFQQIYDTVIFGQATPEAAAEQLVSNANDAIGG
ncbi:ABC transporter substrate-binding protein [Nocardioides bruguierae]|uniref:ABC transporter substrate-binding protein n=1 Tax=Nocardioides bruguierae TaxID=2945102 RepID=UPI002022801D|nr:extracellular solute-binding protein [Nocardioides bruguierae]MCL8026822.1 extracellular solute-binding protein [Nocardioides bruguierae]